MTTFKVKNAREAVKVVIVGHVDHGKSTLIGRLLHDTGSLPEGKLEAVRAMCERRGMPLEYAFVLDALQAERDQGVTIDTTQIWLRAHKKDIVIIDAPGHKEFLRNMVTGAAQADAAVLVIDAVEGLREQTRRHSNLLRLLGVSHVVIVVNKMDLVAFQEERFVGISAGMHDYLGRLGLAPAAIIPVSARDGQNIASLSSDMTWYDGPTVVEALDAVKASQPDAELPLRFPIQDVYKFDTRRLLVGRVETGRLSVGDRLLFSPSNNFARVASIEGWPQQKHSTMVASAGQSIAITLDDHIFVERGALASAPDHAPIETDVFRSRLLWLGTNPLEPNRTLRMRLATMEVPVVVQSIEKTVDVEDLSFRTGTAVDRNEIAEVTIRARKLIALDPYSRSPRTGRFVLIDEGEIAGGGIISMDGYADQRRLVTVRATNLQRVEHRVSAEERSRRNGHRGGVLWLTGLSGAGKSTLAIELERRLFDLGYQVYVLDGDNVRQGLNANLGFSPDDRAENIRRVGEVAAMFSAAGLIVITAFISPYRSERARASQAAAGQLHEIYVKAPLDVCEKRDPKGLYRKARAGAIRDFTGIDAPYEAPEQPHLTVDTAAQDVEGCVNHLVEYVRLKFAKV